MGMRDMWRNWTTRRARRFLTAHADVTMQVMRQDPDIAAQAIRRLYEMQASGQAPSRDTIPYPNWSYSSYPGAQPMNRTLPKSTPWTIRLFSTKPPARRALNAIKDPICDLPFEIRVVTPPGHQPGVTVPEPTDEQRARIIAATQMLRMPNNDCTWRLWLTQVIEDMLIFGAGCSEVQENTSDERPLFLWPTDAQSIRINAMWQPGDNVPHYAQGRGYPYGLISTVEEVTLDNDEIMYMKLNARTSDPFGFGYLEVAYDTVNSFLGAMEYATRRASNSTPNFGIFLGENVTPDQVRRWQHYWENEIEGYGKVPILGGGKQPSVFNMTNSGNDQLWLQWQEFLIRVIAMSFGLSPFKLGLERDVNRSTASASQENDWSAIGPVANTISDYITHWLLWYRLGWKDLEFIWNIRTTDELKHAEIMSEQWNADAIYVDEIRKAFDRPPLPDGLGQMTRTAYQAAIKASFGQMPGQQSAPGGSSDMITPLDDVKDTLSPQESAFLRASMREARRNRVA